MPAKLLGFREFERDLERVLQPETIHRRIADNYGDEIIKHVIASAHAGLGPGNKPYPAYSPEYEKRKRAQQGSAMGNWLRGISRTGNVGGMLDAKNFSWGIDPKGNLWLVWTAPDEKTGIYAEVHNEGKPIGRGGPRKKREFMHFEALRTLKAVEMIYQKVIDELAAEFSTGYVR